MQNTTNTKIVFLTVISIITVITLISLFDCFNFLIREQKLKNQLSQEKLVLLKNNHLEQQEFYKWKKSLYHRIDDSQNDSKKNSPKLLNYNIYDRHNNQKLPTFEKLFGMENEKKQLFEIKDFLKNTTKAKSFGIEAPSGVLLHGVPGVGKTVLVQALAKETDLPLIMVNGSDFVSKYKGESTEKVRELFEEARKLAPSIIFIDECEMALNDLSNVDSDAEINNTVNAFKEELTSLQNDPTKPIFFVGATNYIDRIDEAIKSRISNLIEVETLKTDARLKFLNFLIQTKFTKINPEGKEYLALLNKILEDKPALQSQRQMLKILEKGAFLAFKENVNATEITAEHLKAGLLNFMSETEYQKIIAKYQKQ
ncbi:ATP-binding protein [Candidatus Phytoplasma prunorum]|uniref:ATP-binding protein n=1 Tax=Candidatus Phytoplasma prunorum TaxID=47565 RepID=UPI002FF0660E